MRDLFCGNADRPGALPVEEGFLLRETPEPMRAAVEQEKEALEAVQHRYRLPKALSILKSAALMVGLIMAASILRADVSLAEAYRNAPWVEWIGGGSLLAAGVLFLIEKLKQRRAGGSAVVQAAFSGLNRAEAAIREYHSIPADAEWVEILAPSACGEDEDPDVPLTAGNREHRLFVRDGALCLFDGERLYAFPRKELTGIRLVEQEIGLEKWNKGAEAFEKQFRRCGVTQDGKGQTKLSFCCALDVVQNGETSSLLFPAYELAAIQRLSGLPAPELPRLAGEETDRVRPRFYWKPPVEDVGYWFTREADTAFKTCHPVLYGVLVTVGLVGLLLPMILFYVFVSRVPGAIDNRWAILGVAGGFVMGIGLANLVAAWQQQYLGHLVTIASFLAGGAMMAVSWLLVC